jgi:hypothetical protein
VFGRRGIVVVATVGAAIAVIVPAASSSASSAADEVCGVVEPAGTEPATVETSDPASTVEVEVTLDTETAVPVTDASPPTSEPDVPVTEIVTTTSQPEVPVTDVATPPSVPGGSPSETTAAVVDTIAPEMSIAGFGMRGVRRHVAAEPAPPPRQIIRFDTYAYRDATTGELKIERFGLGAVPAAVDDPCGVTPTLKLLRSNLAGTNWAIEIPALEGWRCQLGSVRVKGVEDRSAGVFHLGRRDAAGRFIGTVQVHFSGPDLPRANAGRNNGFAIEFTLKCTPPAP